MQQRNKIDIPDSQKAIPTLDHFPQARKRVVDILALAQDIDISEQDMEAVGRKLGSLIRMIKTCISHPEHMLDVSTLLTGTMADIRSREIVQNSYNLTPLSLTDFSELSLAAQLVFLFAHERGQNMPGAVCHHWTIFWYNFWKECKK